MSAILYFNNNFPQHERDVNIKLTVIPDLVSELSCYSNSSFYFSLVDIVFCHLLFIDNKQHVSSNNG